MSAKGKIIAKVVAREGGGDGALMSLDQYVEWAERERHRMFAELQQQLDAELERVIFEPTIH